jgi:aerobic carbon-monoxide dehydrogenase small subunit
VDDALPDLCRISLRVNGAAFEREVEPRRTLADFLRDDLGLTGTHVGCEHGICGACTVLLDGRSVQSCIVLAAQADGRSVTTVEGLSEDGELHPLQRAFQAEHALQCGFCTPGFLMTATELLEESRDEPLTDEGIRDAIGGNLCRCTGYQNIVAAIRRVAEEGAS